jgi:hypothetical protein
MVAGNSHQPGFAGSVACEHAPVVSDYLRPQAKALAIGLFPRIEASGVPHDDSAVAEILGTVVDEAGHQPLGALSVIVHFDVEVQFLGRLQA